MWNWLNQMLWPTEPEAPKAVLDTPVYVGHKNLNGSEVQMKAFMDSLMLPVGSKWFFLQPGKYEVKLETPATGDHVRARIQQTMLDRVVTLSTHTHGLISRYQIINFERASHGDMLNDWKIEISTKAP